MIVVLSYVGAEVKDGDILVGKVTPKGVTELTAEDYYTLSLVKKHEVRDTSLRVPHMVLVVSF